MANIPIMQGDFKKLRLPIAMIHRLFVCVEIGC